MLLFHVRLTNTFARHGIAYCPKARSRILPRTNRPQIGSRKKGDFRFLESSFLCLPLSIVAWPVHFENITLCVGHNLIPMLFWITWNRNLNIKNCHFVFCISTWSHQGSSNTQQHTCTHMHSHTQLIYLVEDNFMHGFMHGIVYQPFCFNFYKWNGPLKCISFWRWPNYINDKLQ